MNFGLRQADELLATTRAVRKRLNFDRSVPRAIINDCIALSQQSPTGGNSQGWRWEYSKKRLSRGGSCAPTRRSGLHFFQKSLYSKEF